MKFDGQNANAWQTLCLSVLIGSLLVGLPVTANAQERARWTNDALILEPSSTPVEDPATYFHMRTRAIALVRSEDWVAAEPLLEMLVSQYPDDGDLWYLLGLTQRQTENWEGSTTALRKALALGVAIGDIPTGSRPSNDIMIQIADAYAAMGDAENTQLWISRSLEARYDDRPSLGQKPNLRMALSEEQYARVVGTYLEPDLSRDESWRVDLRYLALEIQRLHVDPFHAIDRDDFLLRVEDIKTRIPLLTDRQIVFAFMDLVGSLGNGHNLILPVGAEHGSFARLPLEFYWFSDGLFVVGANEAHQEWIGSRVDRVGNIPVIEALERTAVLNASDNNMQRLWLAPYYVSLPDVLEGLQIVDTSDSVTLTLTRNNEVHEIQFAGEEWSFTGFPRLPSLSDSEQPLYLSNHDRIYWFRHLPDQQAIFVQFNWVSEYDDQTLADFSRELIDEINRTGAENLILDLRLNQGGNGSILPSILRAIVYFEGARPDGRLFVVAGRGTYSAAHNLLTDIDRLTNAIIVGEPSGSRPNAIGEAGWFRLPYSGLRGLVSTQFHQRSGPEDHRIWIAPHVPVSLNSEQYFSGVDPAMEAIEQIIAGQ